MIAFDTLATTGRPLVLPGAHDALSARMIEAAGFSAYGVGGSALAAVQLALPDAGLQSFGEYRDAVARIIEGSSLPVMVDGENGFGDAKAVTRTVRSFEKLGASAIAFEDLVLPPRLDRPPAVSPREEIQGKLRAALAARQSDDFQIVGRSDAAYAVDLDEAILRAASYEELGVDAVIVPGLADADAYKRLRDAVRIPIVAVIVPGSPWYAPSLDELARTGIEVAIYPAAILWRVVIAMQEGLAAIRDSGGAPPADFDPRIIGQYLRTADWAEVDSLYA
jgi:2-methylisocitrate lyase-like PEP mutase family enzyme